MKRSSSPPPSPRLRRAGLPSPPLRGGEGELSAAGLFFNWTKLNSGLNAKTAKTQSRNKTPESASGLAHSKTLRAFDGQEIMSPRPVSWG